MYILMLYMLAGSGGVITAQEFTSKQNCENAAHAELKRIGETSMFGAEDLTSTRYYACVPK